jgi:hypothetical protein
MQKTRPGILLTRFVLVGALLFLAGAASAQNEKAYEFDKVAYLFGPTARTTRDQVTGEVAKGSLHFDSIGKFISFSSPEGHGVQIPYDKIQSCRYEGPSMARAGSFAVGAGTGALFIRQHKHFLNIRYTDEKGALRTALFQLDKGNYEEVLKTAQQEIGPNAGESPKSSKQAVAAAAPAAPAQAAGEKGDAEVKSDPASPAGLEITLPVTGLKMRLPTGNEEWEAKVEHYDSGDRDQLSRVKPSTPGMFLVNLRTNPEFTDCKAFLSSAQAAVKSHPDLLTSPNYLPADWPPFAVDYVPDFMVLACYPMSDRVLGVEIRTLLKLSDAQTPQSLAAILNSVAEAAKAK